MDKLVAQLKNLYVENGGTHLKQFVCIKDGICPSINIFKTVAELHSLGYQFVTSDYLSIIGIMMNGKNNSFIVNKQIIKTDSWNRKELVSFVFSNYTPSDALIRDILDCYKSLEDEETVDWINILTERGYIFNIFNTGIVIKKGYSVSKIIQPENIKNIWDFINIIKALGLSNKDIDHKLTDKQYDLFRKQIVGFIEVFHKLNNIEEKYIYYLEYLNKSLFERDIEIYKNLIDEFAKKGIFVNKKYIRDLMFNQFDYEKILKVKNPLFSEDEINNNLYAYLFFDEENDCHISDEYLMNLIEDGYIEPTIEIINDFIGKYALWEKYDVCEKYMDYFESKNILPIMNLLQMACLYNLEKSYKKIIDTHKIVPDKMCLDNCVSFSFGNVNKYILTDILDSRVSPDNDTINSLSHDTSVCLYLEDAQKTVEFLIRYGLKITLDVLKMLLQKNIFIDNLERFDIKYDEQFYFICHDASYFIDNVVNLSNNTIDALTYYDKFFTIDRKILDMWKLFRKKGQWNTIKKYLIKHNLKPDRYCMEYSCINNKKIAELLFKTYGCKPTPKSIAILIGAKNQLCIDFYVNFYCDIIDKKMLDIDSDYMMKPYDITIV